MGDVSKARKNVIMKFGIWSVIVCMAAGLVMNMRPSVILQRSVISFAIAGTLGYMLMSIIQMHSSVRKKPPADKKEDTEELDEQGTEADAAESQAEQVIQEPGA